MSLRTFAAPCALLFAASAAAAFAFEPASGPDDPVTLGSVIVTGRPDADVPDVVADGGVRPRRGSGGVRRPSSERPGQGA